MGLEIATWDEKEKQVKEQRYNFGKFFKNTTKDEEQIFVKHFLN